MTARRSGRMSHTAREGLPQNGAQPVYVRAKHAQAIDPGIFLFPARPLGEVAKVQRAAAFFGCVVPHPQARLDQRDVADSLRAYTQ